MANRSWLQLGGTEIANSRRVVSYMDNARCNTTIEIRNDDSWPDLHRYLSHPPYGDPATDNAPWFNADQPSTGDFLGVWVMSMSGMDSAPLNRQVVQSAGAGGAFVSPRWNVREITVEAVLVANTPTGLEYGIEWLNSALVQDQCDGFGMGRELRFLQSAPYIGWEATDQEVRAAGIEQERWLGDVVCTDPIKVEERFGKWDKDKTQSIAARVSFTLSAGNPFVWKSRRALVPPTAFATGSLRTVTFERVDAQGNWSGTCEDATSPLVDPALPAPITLPRPMTPASAVGTMPFTARHMELVIPASAVRPWETMIPTVVIQAGPNAERSLRVQWVRGSDTSNPQCDSIGEALIAYIPPRATLTLDGVTGRATVIDPANGIERDATSVVSGRNGAPWRPPVMRCGDEHVLIAQSSSTVHAETVIAAHGAVRMN